MKKYISAAVALTSVVAGQNAMAAGFEKSTMFSGKYAGMANAATGAVTGSESLYFNPAGLARGESDITLNVSPTWSTYGGPITSTTANTSQTGMSPIFAAFANYKLTEKLGIGAGAYVSAGSSSTFENVAGPNLTALGFADFSAAKFDLVTKLSLIEYTLGAGYEIIDGLTFGASARMASVTGELTSPAARATAATPGFYVSTIDGLTDSVFSYRVGLQYAPKDAGWGVGISYRGVTEFSADGDLSVKLAPAVAPGTLNEVAAAAGTAVVSGQLPQALSVGGFWDASSSLKLLAEYTYTGYGAMSKLGIVTTNAEGTSSNDLTLNWANQSNWRLGAQYAVSDDIALRAGYVLTTQVTDTNNAAASFVAPGTGHTITLGAGTAFLDKKLGLNIAADYSTTSGAGKTSSGFSGDFTTTGVAAHVGLSYAL